MIETFSLRLSAAIACAFFLILPVSVKQVIASASAATFSGVSITCPCRLLTNKSVAPLYFVVMTGFAAARASRMNLLDGS